MRRSASGAPVLLVALRLAQGLALGGEYGGAATYVAEHVPTGKRGYYTSYIQTTATLGFFLSLAVIGSCRLGFGEEAFRGMGLARAVPDLGRPARGVRLHPAATAGVAGLRRAEDRGPPVARRR